MNASENICPVCKSSNELEAVVCWNCSAALEDPFMDPGHRTKTTDSLDHAIESAVDWSIDEATVPHSGIAVYVVGMPNPAYIDSKGEFALGRRVEKTAELSETLFDLAPLGGYGLGVSRRHAVIKRAEHGYEVLDLGSVNGTWLNGERIAPHRLYPLPSGSHLRLGSMRLYVVYRSDVGNK
jgi:hypothetical protein